MNQARWIRRILPGFCAVWTMAAVGARGQTNSYVTADFLIATQAVRQTQAGGTNYFTGSVGVGTTTPLTGLDVRGTVMGQHFEFRSITGYRTTAWSAGTHTNCRFSGEDAGTGNSATDIVGIGYRAAYSNRASSVNGFGKWAANENQGANVNALGWLAASRNVGYYVNALGYYAGRSNTANYVNAQGGYAAHGNTGIALNALGYKSGYANVGHYCSFIGDLTGYTNNSSYVNIIGRWDTNLVTQAERTYLGGDLELYDPPSSGGSTSGNALQFQSGARLQASGTNLYVTTGNVGIGTNSPQVALHVAGAARFDQGVTYLPALGDISMGTYTNLP